MGATVFGDTSPSAVCFGLSIGVKALRSQDIFVSFFFWLFVDFAVGVSVGVAFDAIGLKIGTATLSRLRLRERALCLLEAAFVVCGSS